MLFSFLFAIEMCFIWTHPHFKSLKKNLFFYLEPTFFEKMPTKIIIYSETKENFL